GEGSEADFLIGPVLYTVSYAIAAADDEYDVAFSCVHPFLIFFSEFFAGVCSAPVFEGDDVLHVFDFAEYLLGFFFFYDLYVSISGLVWFFFIGNFYKFEFDIPADAFFVLFYCLFQLLLFYFYHFYYSYFHTVSSFRPVCNILTIRVKC